MTDVAGLTGSAVVVATVEDLRRVVADAVRDVTASQPSIAVSVEEAAGLTGVSESTLRGAIRQGLIRAITPGSGLGDTRVVVSHLAEDVERLAKRASEG